MDPKVSWSLTWYAYHFRLVDLALCAEREVTIDSERLILHTMAWREITRAARGDYDYGGRVPAWAGCGTHTLSLGG